MQLRTYHNYSYPNLYHKSNSVTFRSSCECKKVVTDILAKNEFLLLIERNNSKHTFKASQLDAFYHGP